MSGKGYGGNIPDMIKGLNLKWGKRNGLVLLGLLLTVVVILAWLVKGRLDLEDPWLEVPEKLSANGPKTTFLIKAGDRISGLREIKITLKQGDEAEKAVLTRAFPPGGEAGATVEVPVTLDLKALGLKDGRVTLTAVATDRSWGNFFNGRSTRVTRTLEVELTPLGLTLVGISHLLQAGGSGLVVYRVSKPPKETGLKLGNRLFQGYPLPKGNPGDYVAFFAVPLENPGSLSAEIVARSFGGSEVKQGVPLKIKPKKWRQDKISLSEGFLRQVAAAFPDAGQGDLLKTFLEVNRQKRQANHERVQQVTAASTPQPLWQGAFLRYQGKPMARFGDRRLYIWQNRVVDEQVHLGEDLASLVHSPVPAGNRGTVVLAEPLGIYGNTVILDHGLGLFSMYSHLSQMAVKAGDQVDKGQILGRTGSTGLAGGDHLHFSVLVHGAFVNPLEWWDAHWVRDQVEKVWAPGPSPAVAAQEPPAKRKGPAPKKKVRKIRRGP